MAHHANHAELTDEDRAFLTEYDLHLESLDLTDDERAESLLSQGEEVWIVTENIGGYRHGLTGVGSRSVRKTIDQAKARFNSE